MRSKLYANRKDVTLTIYVLQDSPELLAGKRRQAILGYILSDCIYMRDAMKNFTPMDRAFFEASNTAYLGTAKPTGEMRDKVSSERHRSEHMQLVFLKMVHTDCHAIQAAAEAKTEIYLDAAKWVELAGCWPEKRFALPPFGKAVFEEMLEQG